MVLTMFMVTFFIGITQEGHLSAVGMLELFRGCSEYQREGCGSDQK